LGNRTFEKGDAPTTEASRESQDGEEIQAEGGNQHDQRADQNSSLKQWRIFRSGAQHVRPQLLATLPYWLTPTPQHKAAERVPAFTTHVYIEFISLTSIFTSP
jgi:hypothetical protein